MSRRCELTGTRAQTGHKVSHSNRKTNRSFRPNLQSISAYSELLGHSVPLRVTAATIRTIDHNGGLDNYLLTTKNTHLTEDAIALKRKLRKIQGKKAA
jgi:large subunit ribosomal protein L28